jgi:O-antigen/teichoic acid export membrane protein
LTQQDCEKYGELFSEGGRKEGLNKKAVRGGVSVMGAEVGSNLLRIGSMVVLARLLMPEDFGLLAMVTAVTALAERFKDFGLADATVQSREINHRQVSNLFWINLGVCVALALLLLSLAEFVAGFYQEPRLTAVTQVIASTFLFSGLVIQHQALLRRNLRFGVLALIQLYSIVLSLLVAIVLAYCGFGYWALVAREFSRALFLVIGTWFACPWRPGRPQREPGLAEHLSFGSNVTGFNVVYSFSRSFDRILIGRLFGPGWVGLYTNAYQLMALPVSQIQYPVNTVSLPALSALQRDPVEFRAYVENMVRLVTFAVMPGIAFMALYSDVIISLLLGPKWLGAIPLFQVLAVGAFVEPVVHAVGPVLVAIGDTKRYFRLGMINAVALIACLGIGGLFDAIGVAAGYSAATYVALIVCFTYGLKGTPIQIRRLLLIVLLSAATSILTAVVFLWIRYVIGWHFAPPWLIPFFLGGLALYLGLWLLIPGGRGMLASYRDMVKNAVSRTKG